VNLTGRGGMADSTVANNSDRAPATERARSAGYNLLGLQKYVVIVLWTNGDDRLVSQLSTGERGQVHYEG